MLKTLSVVVNEIYKIFHQKVNYLYIFSIAGVVLLSIFEISQVIRGTNQWGFLYLIAAVQTTFNFIGIMVLLIFSSSMISSEVEKKTVRNILIRPVSRLNFFLGKAVAGLIFQEVLILVAVITGVLAGMIYFGFSDLVENGVVLYTKRQIITNFLFACLITSLPLFAVTSYGLLISSFVDSTPGAVGLSIGSFIMLDIAKEKLGFAPYFFSSYIGTPFAVINDMVQGFYFTWTPRIYYCVGVSVIWIITFLSIGIIKTKKRGFNG